MTSRLLNAIERIGNALPDPVTLFVIGALLVMVLSQVAQWQQWSIEKTVAKTVSVDGKENVVLTQEAVTAVGLLSGDGLYWAIQSLVANFKDFPPLAIVLVGMLGIGVAERTGAIAALLKAMMLIASNALLTPAMILVGIMSSLALDAGYVVLPPIAAALYKSMGRSPLVGLAAVFAGVSAGFSANLAITGLDPMLAGFSESAAQIIDRDYRVAPTCNWWFMIVSTVVLTLVGWMVTAWFIEKRYASRAPEEGGPAPVSEADPMVGPLSTLEKRGLFAAGVTLLCFVLSLLPLILIEGAPLYGKVGPFHRWVWAFVPLLFLGFLLPGLAYGLAAKQIRSDKQVAKIMARTMADMGPYIVLAFFAAQFVAYFKHSNLGQMLALMGGQLLASAQLPPSLLLACFIGMTFVANLFIGSASGKYAFFAPVFVPMFMIGAQISPELTQAAYRVGDSASNVIAPLNPYLVIILVFARKYMPKAGLGTLVALMLPYAVIFVIVWTSLLICWTGLGLELGKAGPLWYTPPGG